MAGKPIRSLLQLSREHIMRNWIYICNRPVCKVHLHVHIIMKEGKKSTITIRVMLSQFPRRHSGTATDGSNGKVFVLTQCPQPLRMRERQRECDVLHSFGERVLASWSQIQFSSQTRSWGPLCMLVFVPTPSATLTSCQFILFAFHVQRVCFAS